MAPGACREPFRLIESEGKAKTTLVNLRRRRVCEERAGCTRPAAQKENVIRVYTRETTLPDYRKLHNSAGNSEKLAQLTDFEHRVWLQYRASADDFGVCPFSAAKLQGDNRRLAKATPAQVMKALHRSITVGLILVFEHQGQQYLCQGDWQDYEDVRYPRQSIHPVPSAEVFPELSNKTSELFRQFHKKFSAVFLHPARAGARETLTLTETPTQTPTLVENPHRIEGEGPGEGQAIWDRLVAALPISDHTRGTWFTPCRVLRTYPNKLVVGVPGKLFIDWIPKHYTGAIDTAKSAIGEARSIEFVVIPAQERVG